MKTRPEKHDRLAQFLEESFPGSQVEQKLDFDSGAQAFKVNLRDGNSMLLKVGREFVDDNEIDEILDLFGQWSIIEVLAKDADIGVLVTARGPDAFRRG